MSVLGLGVSWARGEAIGKRTRGRGEGVDPVRSHISTYPCLSDFLYPCAPIPRKGCLLNGPPRLKF
jgi:hypothetical protein